MNKETVKDNINPDHYKSSTSLECIEAMEIVFGKDAVVDFCLCNAWKYIWRWKNKNGLEDLEKAKWYVEKGISMVYDLNECQEYMDILYNKFDQMLDYIKANSCTEHENIEQMQSDYEKRVKADMAAMLKEVDLELYEQYDDDDLVKVKYIRQSIQRTIDKLKEGENDRSKAEGRNG